MGDEIHESKEKLTYEDRLELTNNPSGIIFSSTAKSLKNWMGHLCFDWAYIHIRSQIHWYKPTFYLYECAP
jgi:hypothetical protein